MLTIVFAETALEFFKGKALDANDDWKELARYDNKDKRGRPDIAHDLLKLSLDSELNKRGLLRVFVHTFDDRVITVSPKLRLPRAYGRFLGLVEDLNKKNKIAFQSDVLLKIEARDLKTLLHPLQGKKIVLEAKGGHKTLKEFSEMMAVDIVLIIGGFPHGDFLDKSNALDGLQRVALGSEELTAPAVLAKALTCAELANGF